MKNKRNPLAAGLLGLALLLGGCAGAPAPYGAPVTAMPAQWRHAGADTLDAQAATGAWWKAFGDPALDALEEEALARNNDLAAAAIRVRRAQLQARLAENRPAFSGSVNSSAGRSLDGGGSTHSSAATLGASYEIDLWSRIGSQTDAARWEALATVQDRESAAQALAGTTATLYWQIAYLNQRVNAAVQSIAYAERTLQLVQAQYGAGSVSSLEVAEARQSVASQKAALSQLQQQYVETANALALLFDGAATGPGAPGWSAPQALPGGPLPAVDAGLPAALLGRRPDLRAAELRLREALANVDATRASYYPALSLTGSLGSSSGALANVLQNPVAALGAGLTLPFLQFTEMRLNTEISRTQYEEAVVNFRQTLYTALGDVDNALSARRQYEEQAAQLAQSLADARTAERLYEVRYRSGAVSLNVWLDAQEKRRNAEIALAENRFNRLANHATLFQALGGGMPPGTETLSNR
ncbi:efflux transporter outer membrane subunit [Ramlibacter sp. H39-3-26]|uniref:efflux transporter outer membrane subunit n=1 Tax=Curvibacter soli TaxID=3031331 RepID=UPI0023D9F84E|nr:efflux transporter outer membrane subunit [Ramlibacter sp. H39-3-26]MDF1485848.1 efflux transporter outer membrane subunit [Ramlibacter sp. H39-3-26]